MRAQGHGLQGARRVLVYGVTGSGKTTLAGRLSRLTGIEHTSVDDLTWLPGWVERPVEQQRELFTELCAGDSWILDSAYRPWVEVVLARADLVVALDLPRVVSLARLLRRTALRSLTGEVVCNGNVETWRKTLARDSVLLWHFRSFTRKRSQIAAWERDPSVPPVRRVRSSRQLRHWLAEVAGASVDDPARAG